MHMFFERIFLATHKCFFDTLFACYGEGKKTPSRGTNRNLDDGQIRISTDEMGRHIRVSGKRGEEEEEEKLLMDHSHRKVTKHEKGEVSW